MSLRVGALSCAGLLLFCIACMARPAAAGGDDATAEALFVQAREAMGKRDFAKACPMLEESYRLVPGIGTKFNLGDCYENLGLSASAWASFRDAAAASKLAGQKDRETAARERASRLEDKLCRLTIQVSSPPPALTVTRDGVVIGPGQWNVALPVDPGSHLIEAKAPSMTAWSTSFAASSCPSSNVVVVAIPAPAVAAAPLAPTPTVEPPPTVVTPTAVTTRSIVTVTSLGLGIAGLGLGSYFGLRALSLRDQSNEGGHCSGTLCDDRGSTLRDESRSFGTGATIAFVTGGALLALGAFLWLTDNPTPKAR